MRSVDRWCRQLALASESCPLPLLRDRWGVTEDRDGRVQFAEAGARTPEEVTALQWHVRVRVLRWFALLRGLTHL
jgi:hypothetical protein